MSDKLRTIYSPSGKALKVNSHVIARFKEGDKTLKGFSLEKPSK